MATNQMERVVLCLRNAAFRHEEAGVTDGQLLEKWLSSRDEVAFAALVRRHGPMVWGVCRRVLGNHHDAEDAFQATFLVLSRKAASIVSKDKVANWLYGVAYKLALKARAAAAKRRARERQVEAMPETARAEEKLWEHLQPLLDEEISRLSDKYREAIVLCDLQGMTRKEAARHLHVPEGTVASRLAAARATLAKRLTRRGLAMSSAALATLLAEKVASASLPRSVAYATIKAASLFAAGQTAAAGLVSFKAATLAEEAIKTILLTKLKIATAFLLAFTALAAGASGLPRWSPSEQRGEFAPRAAAVNADSPGRLGYDAAGDPLPAGAVARLGTARLRHGGEVTTVAFFAGGKSLASGGQDGAIRLWTTASGKEVWHRSGHHLAMAPDGKTWAAWAQGTATTITLFDAATGKRLREFERRGQTHAVAFSPDGKTLAAGGVNGDGLNQLSFWEVATGKELPAPQMGAKYDYVHHLEFAPNGKLLATSGETDGSVRLWELATRKEVGRFQALKTGGTEVLSPFAFAPDGKSILSGGKCSDAGAVDPTPRLWDIPTGKELRQFIGCALDACSAVAFAPDGGFLVTGHGSSIAVWDCVTGKLLRKLEGHQDTVRCLAFSADGKTLASGSSDCTVRLWDFATGKSLHAGLGHQGRVTSVATTGKVVISAGQDKTIRFWDLGTNKEIRSLTDRAPIHALAVSPDGKRMASRSWTDPHNGSTIALWDLATGKELGRSFDWTPSPALAFSPDSRSLAVGSARAAYCLDEKGKRFSRASVPRGEQGSGDLPFVVVSPDGKSFAWCNAGICRISETATGKELHRVSFQRGGDSFASVSWGAFLGDSNTLLLNVDGAFCLWDVDNSKELRRFGGNPPQWQSALSPDGKTLAATCEDGTIRLWEVQTGKERRRLRGHHGAITALAWSADGEVLVTGGADTTVLVWDVRGLIGRPNR